MSGSEKPEFSDALPVGRALDLTLPDSRAVRDAFARAQADSLPWLFNHVVRSWLYGAKLAHKRKLTPDTELVAVAVLLHDLGLTQGDAPDRRFEVVGAKAARTLCAVARDGRTPCRSKVSRPLPRVAARWRRPRAQHLPQQHDLAEMGELCAAMCSIATRTVPPS